MLDKLPVIGYNQVYGVSDITNPVNVSTSIEKLVFNQTEGNRADIIADLQYSNSKLDYLVFLANNIIDPLDFPVVTQQKFDQLIINQFGSIDIAQQQIVYFQNNWVNDHTTITSQQYNSLSQDVKQLYDLAPQQQQYTRKKLNNRKSTSQIVVYNTSNCLFTAEQYVGLVGGGSARVKFSTPSVVIVDHVIGNYNVNSITDGTNLCSVTVASVQNVISLTEAPYYSPVTVYDYLFDQVTAKRQSINLYQSTDIDAINNNLIQ